MNEAWFALLVRETEKSSCRAVADKLGYSLTSISLVLSGKYNGGTGKIAEKVLKVYGEIKCPHLLQTITLQACIDYANSPAPTHNPAKMAHWRACRNCPRRPEK